MTRLEKFAVTFFNSLLKYAWLMARGIITMMLCLVWLSYRGYKVDDFQYLVLVILILVFLEIGDKK